MGKKKMPPKEEQALTKEEWEQRQTVDLPSKQKMEEYSPTQIAQAVSELINRHALEFTILLAAQAQAEKTTA